MCAAETKERIIPRPGVTTRERPVAVQLQMSEKKENRQDEAGRAPNEETRSQQECKGGGRNRIRWSKGKLKKTPGSQIVWKTRTVGGAREKRRVTG